MTIYYKSSIIIMQGTLAQILENAKEDEFMATSSIFARVKITDPRGADKFAKALEASEREASKRPSQLSARRVSDPEEIRRLMIKRTDK